MAVPRLFCCDLSLSYLFFGLFLCAFLFEFFYFKIRGWPVSVCSSLGFRCEIMERYEEGTASCKRSFISVSKQGAHLKMTFSLGQRPIIIVPIDSNCNLPQNKTHSYASEPIVDPYTFSRREIAQGRVQVQRKNGVSASIQGRYISLFWDTPKSLYNEKMIIQKSLHPQFGHCMAKQQLINSHNIAKYS